MKNTMKKLRSFTARLRVRPALALILAAAFVLGALPLRSAVFAVPETVEEDKVVYDGYYDFSGELKNMDGVVQGETDKNFTAHMPISTIFIDESVINRSIESRNSVKYELLGEYATNGWFSVCPNVCPAANHTPTDSYNGDKFLTLDFKRWKGNASPTTDTFVNTDHTFEGDIVSFTYENGAKMMREDNTFKNLDVVITYSNLHLAFQNGKNNTTNVGSFWAKNPMLSIASGTTIAMSYNEAGDENLKQRTGIYFDVNIKVVDPDTDERVNGTFYYSMVDIDINQEPTGNGTNNFSHIYNAAKYYNYSEQVILRSGYVSDVFVPGFNPGGAGTNKYKSQILMKEYVSYLDPDGILFLAGKPRSGSGYQNERKDENTFYSGFCTVADNTTGGITLTYRGFAGCGGNKLETNLFSAAYGVNFMLKATSDHGGEIDTTRNGNGRGDLKSGELVEEDTIFTARGQSVTYTMTPKLGYRVKAVWVNRNNSIDYTAGGVKIQNYDAVQQHDPDAYYYKGVDENGDGAYDYYTFTFDAIAEDNSIHVEWEPTRITVKKTVEDETADQSVAKFNFRMEIAPPDESKLPDNVYKVKAWDGGNAVTKNYYHFTEHNREYTTGSVLLYDGGPATIEDENGIKRYTVLGYDPETEKWLRHPVDMYEPTEMFDTTKFLWRIKKITGNWPKEDGTTVNETRYLLYNEAVGVYEGTSPGENGYVGRACFYVVPTVLWNYDPPYDDYYNSAANKRFMKNYLYVLPEDATLLPNCKVKFHPNHAARTTATLNYFNLNKEYCYWRPVNSVNESFSDTYLAPYVSSWINSSTLKFLTYEEREHTYLDERDYVDLSTLTWPEGVQLEKVTGRSDTDYVISLPMGETFDRAKFKAVLDANNVDYSLGGYEITTLFENKTVPDLVETWNEHNPELQLNRVQDDPQASEFPCVYDFTLDFNRQDSPDPAAPFEMVVPLGWSYKIYELDKDKNEVEEGEFFEENSVSDAKWQLADISARLILSDTTSIAKQGEPNSGALDEHVEITFLNKIPDFAEYVVYDFSNKLDYTLAPPVMKKTAEGDAEELPFEIVELRLEKGPVLRYDGGEAEPTEQPTPATELESDGFRFAKSGDKTIEIDIQSVTNATAQVYALVSSSADGAKFTREWRRIVLIPATNVHYEESYLSYNPEKEGEKPFAADWDDDNSTAVNPVWDAADGAIIGEGAGRQSDANALYGFDATYAGFAGDSNGRSMHVQVGEDAFNKVSKQKTHQWPALEFTFTGTGFDLIGRAGLNTGVYVVNVYNSSSEAVVSQIINTRYYGASYQPELDGEQANVNVGSDMRQVPIVHINKLRGGADMPHDTYTVRVQFMWSKGFAKLPKWISGGNTEGNSVPGAEPESGLMPAEKGGMTNFPGIPEADYEFIGFEEMPDEKSNSDMYTFPEFHVYVDAIRVYNPIKPEDITEGTMVYDAYVEAGELDPEYIEIRNIITGGGAADNSAFAIDVTPHYVYQMEGDHVVVDENGNPVPVLDENGKPKYIMPQGSDPFTSTEYKNYGPNNEVYLKNGNIFGFKVNDHASIRELHISAKAPCGSTKMQIFIAKLTDGSITKALVRSVDIDTATEMYYDLSPDKPFHETVAEKFGELGEDAELYVMVAYGGSENAILSVGEIKLVRDPQAPAEPTPNIVADENTAELATALIAGRKGDVNADGTVDMMDALLTMRQALSGDALGIFGRYCGDADENSFVDMMDSVIIIRDALGE